MRLVCQYESAGHMPEGGAAVVFEDRSFADRIGWREIVVLGDGLLVDGQPAARGGEGVSSRLTAYPDDLLAQPLDVRRIAVEASPGGPELPGWAAPDATPIGAAIPGGGPPGGSGADAAIPGGVTEDLAALVDVQDLTPLAVLLSLAVALALGVVHALSPGHGKTIMAAYLVGSGGTSRQAVGLGLAVAASHTLGVLALAAISIAASAFLPPERLYPVLGLVSGGLVIVIGGGLLWRRLRELAHERSHARGHDHDDDGGHAHWDGHDEQGHAHPHPHEHAHPHPHQHTTGGVSWRGMLALGLSGGLVPSTSALILLLGSIAAGRLAYGVVLVLGFGLGMAVVLTGIGLVLVRARRLVNRRPALGGLRRLAMPVQVGAASLVVVLGLVFTTQALLQVL
jgi:ABC-type nickel/cobalt efflux system permease component RcnA